MGFAENSGIATEAFGRACEQMNDFARSVRESGLFPGVKTGADIRCYDSGWRLEKWVEAEINPSEGLSAAWWLELGPDGDKLVVRSNLSISHGELFINLPDRAVTSPAELEEALAKAVADLTGSLAFNSRFTEEVRQRLERKAGH